MKNSWLKLYTLDKAVVKMNRIKELRINSNMKQADLAAVLNCSRNAISNYETQTRDIDSVTICRLCDIFGCTADYLLGRSDLLTTELTPEESSLLLAWRRGDDRARDMVRLALEPFREESAGETAI